MPPLYDQNPAGPVYDGSAANSQEHPSTAAVLSGRVGKPGPNRGQAFHRTQSFYGHLRDPRGVGPGKRFTTKQQNEIYRANKERNGGVLRDDDTGELLVKSKKSMAGEKNPPANEAQIDHIIPRKPSNNGVPGTNSYTNARVISRKRNRAKSNL